MSETLTRNDYLISVLERFEVRAKDPPFGPLRFVRFSLVINGVGFGAFILTESHFEGLILDLQMRPATVEADRYLSERLFAAERGRG